jgi:hypothetical protein
MMRAGSRVLRAILAVSATADLQKEQLFRRRPTLMQASRETRGLGL